MMIIANWTTTPAGRHTDRNAGTLGLEPHDGLLDSLEEGLAPVDRPGHRGLVLRQRGLGHLRLEDLLNLREDTHNHSHSRYELDT